MAIRISTSTAINWIKAKLQASAPASPAAGFLYIFGKTADKHLYVKDEAGTETDLMDITAASTTTMTGKTINLSDNTLSGTTAQFNTALSDGNFATLAGTETLTNKTLTAPTIADFTNANHDHGDADDGGTALASPTITTPTISGAITFPDNVTQTFNPGADNAGLNVGSIAGDPATPDNGDIWYDSTANELTARINGSNTALGAGGGGSVATDSIWDAKGDLAVGTGANTASRLAVGTNGQVLTADSAEATGTKWAAPAAGTLLKNVWDPDAPPSSPGSEDDEFTDGSGGVPGGWTEYDPNSVLTVNESSTYKHLLLTCTTRTGFNPTGIYKSIPAGDFTVWLKYGFRTVGSDYTVSGLATWENGADTSKKISVFGFSPRAAATRLGIYDYTNSTTFSAETVFYFAEYDITFIYLMMRRNAANYYFSWSTNGVDWMHDPTAHNPSFTPTHFGLVLDNANTGATIASSFDFFRYVASDIGYTGIPAGRLAGIYA